MCNRDAKVIVVLGEVRNTCFVAMPFAGLFQAEYDRVIRPAVEEAGLTCIRADQIFSEPDVMADIWKQLRQCRVVLADVSGKNPNVFYELGLARAIGKPALIITRDSADVPFDLAAHRFTLYDTGNPEWGKALKRSITKGLETILMAERFGSGLDGISFDPEACLPAPPVTPVAKKRVAARNFGGFWKGEWIHIFKERRVPHNAYLEIMQAGTEFTGEMRVQYWVKGTPTEVFETLIGSVDGNRLLLHGTQWTFVEQGASQEYSTDVFELQAVGNDKLEGTVQSWPNEPPTAVKFSRSSRKE